MSASNAERQRLAAAEAGTAPWRRFGPYLAERQWGTVREDYSPHGSAWDDFPHDHARSRAYRWGEDGLAGLSDEAQRLCFSLALWNGRDPILKERLFGLTGPEGNHGEDVKELYFYLDGTPTASWLEMLYKYPQAAFPYRALLEENRRRGRDDREFELLDTGVFDEDRYFDVRFSLAKAGPEDLLLRITVDNRGPEAATLHVLPQLWFRNTWSWGRTSGAKPLLTQDQGAIAVHHPELPPLRLECEGRPELLFTENETNVARLYGVEAPGPFKDAFHEAVVEGRREALATNTSGTKAAAWYVLEVLAGGQVELRFRLTPERLARPFADFAAVFAARKAEADGFYAELAGPTLGAAERHVQRQAYAGLVWSQQFYHLDVPQWLSGDPGQPAPPASRRTGRNAEWTHLNNADVLSMPDTWEYPWYAAWDLAFHTIPLARLDPDRAKAQLVLLTREWYMHPNGQLPAYEWAFGDVNPPVHAWAALRVFEIDRELAGRPDHAFLERIFHKLMLNFTWWVNRKDKEGRNVFQGGFLGLDNIGVFDRSAELPTGGHIDQADGTAWMATYSLNLLAIALELATRNPVYEDVATKFFEHFLAIASALTNLGGEGIELWDEEDQFFYDVLHLPGGKAERLKVRSMVGLVPLFAVEVLREETLAKLPGFRERLEWYLRYRPDLASLVSRWHEPGQGESHLLSLLRGHRLKKLLARMLDPEEFLSPYGVRALSRVHLADPYVLDAGGQRWSVSYQPAESESGLFGGNSNWRGPIWFPVNYLIVESLRRFHAYYGPDFKVEHPVGSGRKLALAEIADELAGRLANLFLPAANGARPAHGEHEKLATDPHFRDHVLFHEYFHGDTGRGVGASHQTGWTALVAELLRPAGGAD